MKIGIIAFSNLRYLPYVSLYTNFMKKNNIEYDLIYWSRQPQTELDRLAINKNCINYDKTSKLKKSKFLKVFDFIGYRNFVTKKIKSNKYDYIIVLTTLPAVLISPILIKNYKQRFIVDVRDPAYENIFLFKYILGKIFKHANFVAISSPGFKDFLPNITNKYINVHNYKDNALSLREENKLYIIKNKKIKIRFLGFIRHTEINKKLINTFKNDNRFEVYYHGFIDNSEARELIEYVKSNHINNVYFNGEYDDKTKYELLNDTDILHNVYENNKTKYALGNKLYDGCIHYIPQLTTKYSCMSDIVDKYNLGVSLDFNCKNNSDKVYEWYKNINEKQFKDNCNLFMNTAINDMNIFKEKITDFIIREHNKQGE